MKYCFLDINAQDMSNVAPQFVCERIKSGKNNIKCAGAVNAKGEAVAIAFFDFSVAYPYSMTFLYTYVAENERGNGYATELLSFCRDNFKKKGMKFIYSRIYSDLVAEDFLKRSGFTMVDEKRHLLKYDNGYLKNSLFVRKIIENVGTKLPKPLKIDSLEDIRLKHFWNNTRAQGICFELKSVDTSLSSFLTNDNEIYAGMFGIKLSCGDVFIHNIIELDNVKRDYSVPVMLADIINKADSSYEKISIQTYDSNVYKGIIKNFGEPIEEIENSEWIYML